MPAPEPVHTKPHGHISRGVRVSLSALAMVVLALIFCPLTLLCIPWRHIRVKLGNAYGKLLTPTILWFLGIRPNVKNPERLGPPGIYVSNHVSAIDTILAMWLCPLGGCAIGKKEVAKIPIFGQLYWLTGHILIDRSDPERAIETLNAGAKFIVDRKLSLWIWPEGTRSRNNRLRSQFKKGFVHLAIATRLPLIPVVVYDADVRWPIGGKIHPGNLEIEVLEPVSTDGWTKETVSEHAHAIWSIFNGALSERQCSPPEGPEEAEGGATKGAGDGSAGAAAQATEGGAGEGDGPESNEPAS